MFGHLVAHLALHAAAHGAAPPPAEAQEKFLSQACATAGVEQQCDFADDFYYDGTIKPRVDALPFALLEEGDFLISGPWGCMVARPATASLHKTRCNNSNAMAVQKMVLPDPPEMSSSTDPGG